MKTLKKIYLISFLIGSMLTLTIFVHGQRSVLNLNEFTNLSRPYANAGTDATICNNAEFETHATSSSTMVIWYTSGDGYFINPNSVNTIYIPGVNDIHNTQVILSLHHLCVQGSECIKTSDEMTLYLGNCMAIKER